MDDRIGKRFDDYHLIRELGGGGFGNVYLAEDVKNKARVAIKILDTPLRNDKDVENYINEIRVLHRLKHPNIVPLLDFGVQQKVPFLVMPYTTNGTLKRPRGKRYQLADVISLVKQIAEALQCAHDNRIIHRDVKPENILLGPNYQVWLSDFGIAGVAHSGNSQRNQGIAGTMAYMAPEQVQGFPQKASDQYSLGIMVCRLICGDLPSFFEDL